ncbi:hypothetical protein Hhel01_01803 [Haloferula helveola]
MISMRQAIAVFLLILTGISSPAVGGPVRLCLKTMLPMSVNASDCCHHCCGATDDDRTPCCVDLEKLPDASSPTPAPEVPETPENDLGWQPALVAPPVRSSASHTTLVPSIRGPTPSSFRRALLAIWRL